MIALYIYNKKSFSIVFLIYFIFFISFPSILLSQKTSKDQLLSPERYTTDQNGNIFINVNLWGHVANPGSHLVYDGIDIATLLSVAGGPLPGADLKRIKVIRANNNINEDVMSIINVDKFYRSGDKSDFIRILPNDTVVIEQKVMSNLLSRTNLFSSILQLISLYLQISLISDN